MKHYLKQKFDFKQSRLVYRESPEGSRSLGKAEVKESCGKDKNAKVCEALLLGDGIKFVYEGGVSEDEKLKGFGYTQLIAKEFAKKGYPERVHVDVVQGSYGRNDRHKQVAIRIGDKSLCSGNSSREGVSYVDLLKEALRSLQEANTHRLAEYDKLMAKSSVAKEVDTKFNRALVAFVLQKNGFDPNEHVEITAKKHDRLDIFEVRITLEDKDDYAGKAYDFRRAFELALEKLGERVYEKPFIAEDLKSSGRKVSVKMDHFLVENSSMDSKPDAIPDVEITKGLEAKVLRELKRKKYPDLTFVRIETTKVTDLPLRVVKITINGINRISGKGYDWAEAIKNALRNIPEYCDC
jgi:hypothetical protein